MIHVVLPAYNEAENIEDLLREIALASHETLPLSPVRVIVVDDGSADDTADHVRTFAAQQTEPRVDVQLVQHERNRGLAEAINTGLAHAAEQAEARDIILTMDADNSHTPGLIASMVRKIHEGHDVVIASRYQPGARVVGLTLHRRLLSRVASLLFQAVLPIPNVRDYTCGFRAYRASLIQRVRQDDPNFISEQGFTVMVDILLKLRTQQPEVLMAEVPLLLRYDLKKGASKMNVGRTSRQTLALIVRRRLGGTG